MLKIKIFLGLIIATLLLVSCDIKNPTEGLEVRLQTIKRTTGINVELLDATTNQPIEKNITIKFTGNNNDKIITSSNESITEMTTRAGIAVFALEDGLIPTESNPVILNLAFSGDDIVNNTKQIKVKKAGISNFSVVLSLVSAPPTGVASQSENTGQSNGNSGTSNDVVISTSSGNDNNSGGDATLTMPAGTVLQDNEGNNLSGQMQTTIIYTNPNENSALNTIDLSSSNGQFIPTVAVTIQITCDGQPVSSIAGQGIKLSITLPEGSFNPKTGALLKEGDSVGQWFYNANAGIWEWIQDLIVKSSTTTNQLFIEISTESGTAKIRNQKFFDSFSSDRAWVLAVPSDGAYCSDGTLTIQSSVSGYTGAVYLEVEPFVTWSYCPLYRQLIGKKVYSGDVLNIDGLVEDHSTSAVKIYAYDKPKSNNSKQLLGQVDYNRECEAIVLNFTPPSNFKDVEISVYVKCDSQDENPRVISPDGFSLWAMQVNSSGESLGEWQSIGGFSNGKLTASLEIGAYYIFKTEYDSEFYISSDYESPFLASESGISYSIIDDNRVCDNF